MPREYLCDTNVVSELMRPTPQPHVEEWLNKEVRVYLSSVSVEEIRFGLVRKSLEKKSIWFEQFLRTYVTVLAVDEKIGDRSGRVRAEMGMSGQTRSQADMLIAATAWAHDLTLATRNTRDFEGTGIALFNPFDAS